MNILIIRTDRMGEVILSLPAVKAVKESFPESRITMMISPGLRELLEGVSYIDELLIYEKSWGVVRLAGELRRRGFDIVIILNPVKAFNIASFLAGIRKRVGYNRKCGFLLTDRIEDKKHLASKHEVDYNLELVGKINAKVKDKAPKIEIKKEAEESVERFLRQERIGLEDRVVVIHPWTSNPAKRWPLEFFSKVAENLAQRERIEVIVIGGKDEMDACDKFCERTTKLNDQREFNLINLCGRITLSELAALFVRSEFLVSNDSGPVHLAAAVGTKTIVLFARKDPQRWGPDGEGHILLHKNSLLAIKPEEVIEAAGRMLGGR